MELVGKVQKRVINEDGNMELTILIDNLYNQNKAKELRKDVMQKITLKEFKENRSVRQNNLMWELIRQIAIARGGYKSTEDDWQIYIEALERAGAKTEYIAITPKGLEMLRQHFRYVKVLNTFITEKGVEMAQCKIYYGSSKMTTQEMNQLLEIVEDMAVECNVPVDYERI